MRRSSVSGAGRPSVVTPQHANAGFLPSQTKDLRPLKDPLFKKACQESIFLYFQHRPRAPQISQKTLISPTQHEFQMMFKFLVTEGIDEDYVFGRGGKKFEEECIGVLKDLKYPGVDSLSRTAITAPGTPQGWPSLLAMLMWLVDLSQVSSITRSTSSFLRAG
jgi:kinetochore protein NDC80